MAGSLSIGASGNFQDGSGNFTFDGGGGPDSWSNAATVDDLGAVIIDGAKEIDLGSSVKATSVSITSGDTLDLNNSSYTLEITGSGTGSSRPFINGGTLSGTGGTSSTIKYEGTGSTEIDPTTYPGNLEFAPASGTPSYILGTAKGSTVRQVVDVNRKLTV